MTTQEDILLPRAQRKRMRQQVIDTKPVNQADITYVSDDGNPNNAVLQSVYDNAGQRIERIKGVNGNPNEIDVKGNGIVTTYGQQAVPKGSAIPTAAPNPSGQQVTPSQLANSKTGVVNVPQGAPLPVSGNPTEQMQPKKSYTYDDMYKMLADQKAEEEKRIKKEKRRNLIATIGNGLSALANLYYTTKGAPNAYTPELSAKMRARYDALEKERRENNNAYINARLKILGQQKADERAGRDASIRENYYRELAKNAREKNQGELALKEKNALAAQELANRKQDEVEKNNAEKNRIADERAKAYQTSVNKRTTKSNGGRSGSKYYAYDNEGNIHYYDNKSMWEQAVNRFAKEANIAQTEESTSTHVSDDGFGMQKTSTTTTNKKRTAAEKGADLERNAKANKAKPKAKPTQTQNVVKRKSNRQL